jgi:hypothetical protein
MARGTIRAPFIWVGIIEIQTRASIEVVQMSRYLPQNDAGLGFGAHHVTRS